MQDCSRTQATPKQSEEQMILRIFPPCQRPWSLVFGVGSRVCVCERRTGLKYWRQDVLGLEYILLSFAAKKKKTMNISMKQVKSNQIGEDGNEGYAKGLLAMWCS